MTLLDTIRSPADLRALPLGRLPELAEEIRARIIEVVGRNGGHLTSNLGVVDLTIALHRVFDFSSDRLFFDVGHQCYPHKLLTGRNRHFDRLRKKGGVSGFPEPTESDFDLFSVGHAGTAVATAVGMARADQSMGNDRCSVAVVGDGSIVNGVAFEGLNQAGTLKRQFLVVLNDNEWGISPTQGGVAETLARFRTSNLYEDVKAHIKRLLPKLPLLGKPVFEMLAHLKEGIKATVSPGQIFEPLGLQYVGPVDGHDIAHLIEILEITKRAQHPVLLHVHTVKGKGYDWASAEPGRFHSPKPFTVVAGKATFKPADSRSWTTAFVDCLTQLARQNPKVHALTAGMPAGTGLDEFEKRFPDRCRDIGIAESCTVDLAAGMAKAGLRPVVAIYSTFLQRAFDQVFQEVALQGLPVMFCIDRAGLVGSDGAVHHGFLDIAYLRGLPGFVLMAPIDEVELLEAMRLGLSLDRPCAIRYPRDSVPAPWPDCSPFELGVSRRLREGDAATVLAYGVTAQWAMEAAERLAKDGIEIAVVSARFARPIDRDMIEAACSSIGPIVSVEDHSVAGGFGSALLETAADMGLVPERFVRLGMPQDRFVPHASRAEQLAECAYDADGIERTIRRLLGLQSPEGMIPATRPRRTSVGAIALTPDRVKRG